MDISQYLNYLWHDNDFLHNLLKDVGNLDQDLFFHSNLNWWSLDLLNDFDNFFDMVYILYHFLHLLQDRNLFYNSLDLDYLRLDVCYVDYFFLLNLDLSNFFNYSWNLHNLLYNSLNVFIDFDHLRDNSLNFNNFRDFNKFRYHLLHLINSGNCCWSLDYFLYDLLSSDDLLHFRFDCHNFFNYGWNFLNHFLNVRYNFFNFLDSLIHNNLFNDFLDIFNLDTLLLRLNNFLNELWYLDDFLQNLSHRNDLLDNHFHWHCNLSWHDDNFFDFNWFDLFIVSWNNFINIHGFWNFA